MSQAQGSAGVPYLGSKISLISKAEIRYEGTLYTIDPKEATVALAKVRSFGTEDRPTDRPLPARNEVFEFIIFRGHDIKDLHVCEPPPPQPTEGVPLDPAIVKSSQPPPGPKFAGPPPSGFATSPTQPFAPPAYYGQQQPQQPLLATTSAFSGHLEQGPHSEPAAEKSPPAIQPVDNLNQTPPPASSLGTRSVVDSQSSTPPAGRRSPVYDHGFRGNTGGPEKMLRPQHQNYRYPQPHYHQQVHQQMQQHDRELGHRRHDVHNQDHFYDRTQNGLYARMRVNNNNNRAHMRDGPPRGHRGGFVPRGHGYRDGRPTQPLKFDTEFDFESSNAQFLKDNIEVELKNLSLNDSRVVNGEGGEEADYEEEEEHEQDENEGDVFYDKTKSFFDNISCEATSNSKGQRLTWREERKLNSETFGTSGNFRRNFRGRGNWRGGGNPRRGWQINRGGGDGGYRGYGGYNRGRDNSVREGGSGFFDNNRGNGRPRRNWGYEDRRPREDFARAEGRF